MEQIVKKLAVMAISLFVTISAFAQVTTSSMSGKVTEANGTTVPGATVIAVHMPSGTQYYTATDNNGNYRIQNMRVGGPYSLTVTLLGYADVTNEGAILKLGENFVFDVVMAEDAIMLDAAVVSAGVYNPILNRDKAGASMNVGTKELTTLPTISRSVEDFTRLTPQANGSSFAGRDARMNTLTVDGAAFNNNFGLSSGLPGGSAEPISLDAIEEISVNIAPFDIRTSQFTGAAINAVTKSGDNTLRATAYSFIRPKSFTGELVGKDTVRNAREREAMTYGLTVGGPIIKNKLFFFVSGEYVQETLPSNAWEPSTDGVSNTALKISRTTVSDLERVSNHLKTKYGYNPGKYQDFDNFTSSNFKILARIDWNINKNHKLTLRYNEVQNNSDVLTNANSGPSGLTRLSANRISANSIAFQNSFYGFLNLVRSFTGELNSTFGPNVSNKFLASYTAIKDTRTSDSDIFPFVDILGGGTSPYMAFGYELFTYNNEVKNNTLTIANNLSINAQNHAITVGASYDYMYFKNAYMREATSYYRYASVDDFINDAAPVGFGVTYGYQGNDAPGVELGFGMAAVYAQDEWQINKKLKLTYGIRAELPIYHNKLQPNYSVDVLEFYNGYQIESGVWPASKIQISPRVGFNWDVRGDRSLQIRGGTGLFTGLLPFVWFTNQPNSTGMIQSPEISISDPAVLANLKFNPDYKKVIKDNPNLFPATPSGKIASGAALAEVDKNFKMPQVWRTNLAADVELPWNTIFTLEALFSKDINAVVQKNANLSNPTGVLEGPDNRPYWTNKNAAKVNSNVGSAMILTNTNKGYQALLTAQLTKNFTKGLYGMIAYTYNNSKDVSSNPGSTAASAWSSNTTIWSLNNPELSYSDFAVPHRVVGAVSYRIEYARCLASTFSLYYSGMHQGRATYAYAEDYNGDGNSSDLLYVPRSKNEIKFVDQVADDKLGTLTANEQADIFWAYVNNTPYLKKNKGKYAERFGDLEPWYNRIDFKFMQDIYSNFGTNRRYTLQLSLDILNVANLLSSNWGVYKSMGNQNYDRITPLKAKGRDINNVPIVILNASDAESFDKNFTWTNSLSTGSTWGMLMGIRLIF